MPRSARELFVDGLRSAHAMESESEEMLKRQLDSMTGYPDLLDRLRLHLDQTRGQKRRIEQILDHMGESASPLADFAMSAMGNVTALAHAVARDEVLKNMFANIGFENLQVAAYTSLLALEEEAGVAAAGLLEQSLGEERAMADWLSERVEAITMAYMRHAQRG